MKLDQIERKLTGGEKRSKEAHYKKLKKHKGDFIDRYGKEDGEAIMHAIATNRAKGEREKQVKEMESENKSNKRKRRAQRETDNI